MRNLTKTIQTFLLIFISSILIFLPVSALSSEDLYYYSQNNILFYNPDGNYCETATVVSGSNAKEIIWNFFANEGFTDAQIAGIMGNIAIESNFNPIAHDLSNYWGLFQWGDTASAGYAWVEMKGILEGNGYGKYISSEYYDPYKNEDGKLIPLEDLKEIITLELQFAMERGGATSGSVWSAEVKKTTTIREATEAFLVKMEGAVGGTDTIKEYAPKIGMSYQAVEKRVTAAEQYYELYTGTSISSAQQCNNILGDANNALSYLQQFVTDSNYLYNQNNTIPTDYIINTPIEPSINDSATIKPSDDKIAKLGLSGLDVSNVKNGCWHATYCGQCTALSGWFITTMTSYIYGGGNGGQVTSKLVSLNPELSISPTPTPFSIFSTSGSGYGHTGIVLEVLDDGQIISIENNMGGSANKLEVHQWTPESNINYVDVSKGLKLDHLGTNYE